MRCLSAAMVSARAAGRTWEIIVVDDASSDDSAAAAGRTFPSVRVLRNETNAGFGPTCNRGAREALGSVLVLLNNDLVARRARLSSNSPDPLAEDATLFGVSGKTIDWSGGQANHLSMAARWDRGGLGLTYEDPAAPAPTMFLQGGCCAVRREEFLRLGGFCPLFEPGYWEDYDISYLALKAGWSNLYNPHAEAFHLGQASMRRAFGADYLDILKERNRLLFHWVNLTDPDLLERHLETLPSLAAKGFARGGSEWIAAKALLRALPFAKAAAEERARRTTVLMRSDGEVLASFTNHGAPAGDP